MHRACHATEPRTVSSKQTSDISLWCSIWKSYGKCVPAYRLIRVGSLLANYGFFSNLFKIYILHHIYSIITNSLLYIKGG